MQCKDIPAVPILEFLYTLQGRSGNWFDDTYDNSVARAMPPSTPSKLVLAKMRMLIRSGLVDGCGCGCRGDFVLTKKGRSRVYREAAIRTTSGASHAPDQDPDPPRPRGQ